MLSKLKQDMKIVSTVQSQLMDRKKTEKKLV